MTPSAEDIADADRQFWNLARAIRDAERRGDDPDLPGLYEDADHLRQTGVTPGIRARCGALVDDWRRRNGPGAAPHSGGAGDAA